MPWPPRGRTPSCGLSALGAVRGLGVFLLAGLAITVALEWLNVYVWRNWAYSREMPVVFGIGLTPILQWLLVPLLTLWLARRHLGFSSEEIR